MMMYWETIQKAYLEGHLKSYSKDYPKAYSEGLLDYLPEGYLKVYLQILLAVYWYLWVEKTPVFFFHYLVLVVQPTGGQLSRILQGFSTVKTCLCIPHSGVVVSTQDIAIFSSI